MLNFALCDDNSIILDRLSKLLESIFIKHDIEACISYKTTNPNDLIKYLDENSPNVLILDIDLKSNISGLDVAEQIRKKDKNIYIIFSTAHLEYGLVAYKYKTFDYLPKPLTSERLEDTIIRLLDDIHGNISSYIRLDNNKTIIKQDTIQYIKKEGMKIIFHTDTRDYDTYSSFLKISTNLPKNFIRCHKSYIVNTDKITDINVKTNTIYLNNSQENKCYIGPKYKNNFMEVFKNEHFSNNLEFNKHTK
jgi:two-component system response regulator AgrA